MLKWSLVAILMGQPVPTGVVYDSHRDCLAAVMFFNADFAALKSRLGNLSDAAITPRYSCIPAPKDTQ